MGNGRIYRQFALVLGSGILILGFQNCAKTAGGSRTGGGSSSSLGVVVGPTSQYTKLTFDPALESAVQKTSSGTVSIEADLSTGTINYKDSSNSSTKSCALDTDREQKLKQLLSVGRVCHPDVGAADAVHCLAVSLADIKLASADGSDTVLLRKPLCSNGTFLCDGDDDILRAEIQDLLTNRPVGCQ